MKTKTLVQFLGALRRPQQITLAALMFFTTQGTCGTKASPSETRDSLWRIVAQSDLILKGKITMPLDATGQPALTPAKYASLQIQVADVLKGSWTNDAITVRYYCSPKGSSGLSTEKIAGSQGQTVVVFLTVAEDSRRIYPGGDYYFAGNTETALQGDNEANRMAISNEVSRQRRIFNSFANSEIGKPDAFQPKVAELLDKVVQRRTQLDAFRQLEGLGTNGIPSMIRLMNDARELPLKQISLANKFPGAFEGVRHYKPETVGEALDAILNQITAENFGASWSYHSARSRDKSLNGWRVWLHQQLAAPKRVLPQ